MRHKSIPAHGCRILVADFRRDMEASLIRYASMVARIVRLGGEGPAARKSEKNHRRLRATSASPRRATNAGVRAGSAAMGVSKSDAEVRFLTMLPASAADDSAATTSARLMLRAQVDQYFRGADDQVQTACDVLNSPSPRRLLSYARDFGTDVLLAGADRESTRPVTRITMAAPCATWTVPTSWAPVLRRILVPVDFSPGALASLRTAILLARNESTAKIVVLHVDRQDARSNDESISPARRRELVAKFDDFLGTVVTNGVRIVPVFVKCHRVERAIVRSAEENSADLIVMSTHGRSTIAKTLLPSVSAATLNKCRTAVLTLKPAAAALGWRDALRRRWRESDEPRFS